MAQFPLFFRLRLFTDQNFLSALGTFFRCVYRVIVPSMIQGLHNTGCVTGTVLLCIMHTEFILVHLFCFVGIRLNIPSPILQQRHFNFYNFPFIVTF